MISIDDEVPLFPVNLNGQRLQRYEHARDTHIHKTIAVIHLFGKKTQEPGVGPEDRRIRPSRTQNRRFQRLEEVTSSRVLGRTATAMTNRTRGEQTRAASLLVGCELLLDLYVIAPSFAQLSRCPQDAWLSAFLGTEY